MHILKSEDQPQYKRADDDAVIQQALQILTKRLVRVHAFTANSSPDTKAYLTLHHAAREAEAFGVLFLDNRHRLIADEVMFYGTLNGTAVYPREVMKRALTLNAAAMILYHNHPSGVSEPSRADELLTTQLKEAAAMLDMRILDHMVIGAEGVVSFSERGLL